MPVPVDSSRVIIIGAGLAGLACARRLHELEVPCTVLEAADAVGGRVRTDEVDGFLLDRGFQVLLTAYPEAQRVLDYEALELRRFEPGAMVRGKKRKGGRWHELMDPWRRPGRIPATLLSGAAKFGDAWRVAKLRRQVREGEPYDLLRGQSVPTIQRLLDAGFSTRIVERFFRPFLGGIFLERELSTGSGFFEFVFRMFSDGYAAVPAGGMQRIPEQLAAALPKDTVRLNTAVEAIESDGDGDGKGEGKGEGEGWRVTLAGGEVLAAGAVVVAADGPAAAALLGRDAPRMHGTLCFYYVVKGALPPPLNRAVLTLLPEAELVNHVVAMSRVSSAYAPQGHELVSVSVVGAVPGGEEGLEARVRAELVEAFGAGVARWRYLRWYRIADALPAVAPGAAGGEPAARVDGGRVGMYACGDWLAESSIDGALRSGRAAAEGVREGRAEGRAVSKPRGALA